MDDNKEFVEDILKMIQIGSLNDIKIKLSDGEIVANKDILMARSEYFKTMFNNKFIESQTNCVDMRHCSKVIMDKIVNYFFSGKMKINDLTLAQLLKMTSMLGMMMLDDLMKRTSDFIIKCVVPDSGVNCAFLPELLSGLLLADQLGLVGLVGFHDLVDGRNPQKFERYPAHSRCGSELGGFQNFSFRISRSHPPSKLVAIVSRHSNQNHLYQREIRRLCLLDVRE